MKRLVILFCVVLFGLSACSSVTKDTLSAYLKSAALEAETESVNTLTNISKTMYSYYLPPSIGRRTSTETSNILTSNGINILMNLDVIDVISDSYYDTASKTRSFKTMLSTTENLITFDGAYTDGAGEAVSYRVSILYVNDSLILLTLEASYFIFTAITPISVSDEILYDMIRLARSCVVDSASVLLAYSTRESIDYKRETIDMFSQIAPESGTVLDMISGGQPIDLPDENLPQ
jgi:hypothetical protein